MSSMILKCFFYHICRALYLTYTEKSEMFRVCNFLENEKIKVLMSRPAASGFYTDSLWTRPDGKLYKSPSLCLYPLIWVKPDRNLLKKLLIANC